MAGRNFKCCRSTDFSNYCSMRCLNIFHPKCLEKKEDHVIVSSHKIPCSTKCAQAEESGHVDRTKELKHGIEQSRIELNENGSYIKRQKRKICCFRSRKELSNPNKTTITSYGGHKWKTRRTNNEKSQEEIQKLKKSPQTAGEDKADLGNYNID
ncbi:hypothetical protein JTB14_020818 [Gonioctena quinquepunctata]|nr:hypothetical protein JTB14_020818 [Gonioctena quinquepunctata]